MRQAEYTIRKTLKPGILFCILNLSDIALTAFLLSLGAPELNPVYSSLGNLNSLIATKFILVSLVLMGLLIFNRVHLLKWLNAGMGLIIIWNVLAVITWVA